ncbi:Uncharacterized protein Adt_48852 [Abeliophyllum distichum]|uniref:Uncharacterized protein n=1 Tax=Abeliophyllum distichum TaxID=126358 RepID=A0ABD1NPV0_9LAMI
MLVQPPVLSLVGIPLRRRVQLLHSSFGTNEPRRKTRQGILYNTASPGMPHSRCAPGNKACLQFKNGLSATDISALASMKNAAKCDTWCELQNPVNHRVFERKLRPKPLC